MHKKNISKPKSNPKSNPKKKTIKPKIKHQNYRDLKGEEWRLVAGTEDYYISNMGRFRRGNSLRKISIDSEGYGRCNIGKKKLRVHRLVAEAFIPNPDNLPVVDHLDANKSNNIVTNLRWCTQQENTQAACDMGLGNTNRKTLVIGIDKDLHGYLFANQKDAADKTGVPQKAISKIVLGKERSRNGYRFFKAEDFTNTITGQFTEK